MTEKKTRARKQIDWEGVERDFRAGIKTHRQMADEYGVSHTAIQKKAKDLGWDRDLSAKIKARAEDKVAKTEVANEVAKLATEKEIVEANAEALAGVIRGQRKDIGRLRGLVDLLVVQVEAMLQNSELFGQVAELCHAPDDSGVDRLNDLYRKVIGVPQQTDTTKKLAETLRILIELERKVFKLDDGADPVEAAARGAAQGAAQGSSEASKSMLAELLDELKGDGAAA